MHGGTILILHRNQNTREGSLVFYWRERRVEMKKWILIAVGLIALTVMVSTVSSVPVLTDKQQLGKSIFFDKNLSINSNQSCAACHGPEAGWTGPDNVISFCPVPL